MNPSSSPKVSTRDGWRSLPSLRLDRRCLAVVATATLAVLVFSLGSFFSYQNLRSERQDSQRQEAQRMLLAFEAHAIRLFDYADSYLRAIRAYHADYGNSAKWASFISEIKAPHADAFSGIVNIVDRDGWVVYQSEIPRDQLKSFGNMSSLDHYQYFSKHPGDSLFVGATRLGKMTGKYQFRMARPLLKDGVFAGEVILTLRPEHITDIYGKLNLGPHSSMTMWTLEPKLIARQPLPSPEMYDRTMPEVKSAAGTGSGGAARGSALGTASPFDDFRRDIFFKRLADYPITLAVGVAEQDLDDAMAGARRNLILLAASFALISFVVAALAIRLIRQNLRLAEADAVLRESQAIVDSTDDAIISKTLSGIIKSWNSGAERIFGYSAAETIGQPMRILIPPDRIGEEPAILERISRGDRVDHFETVRRHKDGRRIDISATISPIIDPAGRVIGASKIARDITAHKRLEAEQALAKRQVESQLAEISLLQAKLQEQVIRDPLTGLYNRRYLDETLPRELSLAKREGYALSVIMLDLDHFKRVNDTYGHPAGDEVLKALAALLREGARESDMICRYGGEEFIVVSPKMLPQQALLRVEAWRLRLANSPIQFGDFTISATLSAGIAGFPKHGADVDTLVARADEALYRAKREGRNRVTCFELEK